MTEQMKQALEKAAVEDTTILSVHKMLACTVHLFS